MAIYTRNALTETDVPLGPNEVYRVGEHGVSEIVEYRCDVCGESTITPILGRFPRVLCHGCLVDGILQLHGKL